MVNEKKIIRISSRNWFQILKIHIDLSIIVLIDFFIIISDIFEKFLALYVYIVIK